MGSFSTMSPAVAGILGILVGIIIGINIAVLLLKEKK